MFPEIEYETAPSDEQREALDFFGSHVSERAYPRHFIGREDVLDYLRTGIKGFMANPDRGPQTRVITGAPGIGKTSLLMRLAEVLRSDQITPVRVDGTTLNHPVKFVESFVSGLPLHFADMATSKKKAVAEAGATFFAAGKAIWERNADSAIDRLSKGESVWSVCNHLLKDNYEKFPNILLMVDEAQDIDEFAGKNTIVRDLQLGIEATGHFHIFPIFAGLLNTPSVLGKIGISRAAFSASVLEELPIAQSREIGRRFLEDAQFGLSNTIKKDDHDVIAHLFAVAAEGWPRHLHCYMTALASQVANDFIDDAKPTHMDLEDVMDAGHRARITYSSDVLSRAQLKPSVVLALSSLAQQVPHDHLLTADMIREESEKIMGKPTDIDLFIRQDIYGAIRAGLLQPTFPGDEFNYRFPIPSLHTFLMCNRDLEQTLVTMRRDVSTRLSVQGDLGGPWKTL